MFTYREKTKAKSQHPSPPSSPSPSPKHTLFALQDIKTAFVKL